MKYDLNMIFFGFYSCDQYWEMFCLVVRILWYFLAALQLLLVAFTCFPFETRGGGSFSGHGTPSGSNIVTSSRLSASLDGSIVPCVVEPLKDLI